MADEAEPGVVSLETVIRSTCEPSRLLDLLENFVVYQERSGGIVKLLRPGGIEVLTRIAGLLLAAIAVQLIADAVGAFVKLYAAG